MNIRFSPLHWLAMVTVGSFLAALALVYLASDRPWLGIQLTLTPEHEVRLAAVAQDGPSSAIPTSVSVIGFQSERGSASITPSDLMPEPDALATYAEMSRFFARQTEIADLLRGDKIVFETRTANGAQALVPIRPADRRPLIDLPAGFWVSISVGLSAFIVGMWIWTARRRDEATSLFALASFAILMFTFPAAHYSSRELAIDGDLFRVLSALNHGGALLFGAAMIALLLTYPLPLVPRAWLAVPFAAAGAWWVGDTLQLFDGPPVGIHLPVMIEMAGIVLCTGLQYWRARRDPKARIILRWFGLSVVTGAGLFVLTVIAPNMIGFGSVVPQGYGFAFFLLIHLGIAVGVARYRLFDLDRWAFRILFYMTGGVLLLLVDAALISWVAMGRAPAFGVALVLVALIYLPLRDALARGVTGRKQEEEKTWLPDMIEVTLCRSDEDREARWRALLVKAFQVLNAVRGPSVSAPILIDEGSALAIPAVGPLPPQQLDHSRQGRRLFSPRDITRAQDLCAMLAHALKSHDAYDRGAAEERERITRDMHDNIGIQLLGALHSRDEARKDELIRRTLVDVREIINNSSSTASSLADAMADLRVEIADLVSNAGLTFVWTGQSVPKAPPAYVPAIRAILREAVNNALRHAEATVISVDLSEDDGALRLAVMDDGRGIPASDATSGHGLENMRARALLMKGRVSIERLEPGTQVILRLPLDGDE